MNRFVYALMLGAALILSGCDLLDALKPEPELTINKNEFEIASSGDRCTVTVNANYEFDVVRPEDAAEWIKSKISGADGDQVILTISPNKGYDSRTAEVTIKLKEYDLSETVTIVQKQTDALLLDGEDVVLSYEAGTFTIPVSSNIPYEVTISAEWISLVDLKAMVTENLVFAYDENDTVSDREAYINFKSSKGTKWVTIRQEPHKIDFCMRITHSCERFYVPYFTGLIYTGTVLWGDGSESKYADNIYHDYQDAGEVCVELSFKAGDDEHVVTLSNMTGIKEIDLSGM